jgi:hypothetical protein
MRAVVSRSTDRAGHRVGCFEGEEPHRYCPAHGLWIRELAAAGWTRSDVERVLDWVAGL